MSVTLKYTCAGLKTLNKSGVLPVVLSTCKCHCKFATIFESYPAEYRF